MTPIDVQDLTSRYVAAWNEPDPVRRREAIEALWAEDGIHVLQPPAEFRQAAAGLGFASATLEARGRGELEVRLTRAYQDFVAPGEFTFRARDNADVLRNVVKFGWEMIRSGDGEAAAVGLEILILGPDGRIEADYQFIES